ncbi:hypothetical protein DMA12_25970 [Amycolatopsis balhimycina DSM 5908]|uniref:Uncharacterized protein n=1 Tax=Amycolatopsis balhimycina DSM 5908 TaxID=1081091 RepID=A0A428WD03_AMYBA|nr:hypothetical protein [Amycolatopsis balhimycina]RSM40945.1 hypothetical protein DMA12_25970 [Amycolatopsis balhimycina DSM 5908]
MTDHELTTMLKDLADAPAPPPRIDVDRARRIGGRRRRVRTTALVVGSAAVVAAGGVTAVSVFRPSAAPAPVAVAPAPSPATVVPAPFGDPIVARASFAWLPEQITGVEYAVGAHGDTTLAIGRGELPPMIWLSIHDKEPPVPRDLGGQPTRIPVRVGGSDGYWLTTDANDPLNHGQSYLRWPVPTGQWAELHAYYLAVPDLQQVLTRVAADVRFGNKAVPLPLRISSLPDSFRLSDGYLTRRPDQDGVPWRLVLQYSSDGALATINVSPPGGPTDGLGEPECVTKNGLKACVSFNQPKIGGVTAKELLSRITVLGPDEKKWTTHVIG